MSLSLTLTSPLVIDMHHSSIVTLLHAPRPGAGQHGHGGFEFFVEGVVCFEF